MSSPIRRDTPRLPLTRERIVDAAIGLVDDGGADALTMRAVADRLGTGAMSLYRHVDGREELLDLVLERMAAEIPATPPTGDWRADVVALAYDVRAALLARRQLTILLTSRAGRGAGGLPALERALAIFRSAGFAERDAVLANHALGNYVAGAAMWEAAGLGGETGEARRQRAVEATRVLEAVPAATYPSVAWAAAALFAGTADERFAFGLEVLLDGLEARRRPSGRGDRSRPGAPVARAEDSPVDVDRLGR